MAHKNRSKTKLTWKPYGSRKGKPVPGGQWVKVVNGKQRSFGTATSKSNRSAYLEAQANYERFLDDQRQLNLAKQAIQVLRAYAHAPLSPQEEEEDRIEREREAR